VLRIAAGTSRGWEVLYRGDGAGAQVRRRLAMRRSVAGGVIVISGAASRQLVVPQPRGYLAGRVVTPASPGRPPREGEAGHIGGR
jgi:hypothetical protein